MRTSRTDNGEATPLPVPTDSIWPALVRAYASVGIEPNTAISAQGRIGLINARVRRKLGNTWLSRYLTCGSDAMGVPHADSFDIILNVSSQISPSGPTASTLTTRVTAEAQSPAASGVNMSCGSTGVLESRIATWVRNSLSQRPAP